MSVQADVKALELKIDARFNEQDRRADQMHRENKETAQRTELEIREVKALAQATNGRVQKNEIAIAVLKFAVFTIGGSLIAFVLQLAYAKFTTP